MKKKILIFAPHPDDELFGCAQKILQSVEHKDVVHIAYCTTGARAADKEYAKLRRDAVTKILTGVEVPSKNLHFLGYPDEEVLQYADEMLKEIRQIIKRVQPDTIFIPPYEGGHIAHDLVHYLVFVATRSEGDIREYAMYNNYMNPCRLFWFVVREMLHKLPGNLRLYTLGRFIPRFGRGDELHRDDLLIKKREMCKHYIAVEETRTGKEHALNKIPPDRYRGLQHYNYLEAPHGGLLPLGYTMAQKIPFSSFQQITRRIGDAEGLNQKVYVFNLAHMIEAVHPKTNVHFTKGTILQDLKHVVATLSPRAVMALMRNLYRFLRYGDEAFYAMDGWRIVSRCRIAYKGLPDLVMKENEVSIYACETEHDFRGKRLYPAIITLCLQYLQGEGLEKVYMWTDFDNIASQKGIERAGFRESTKKLFTTQ